MPRTRQQRKDMEQEKELYEEKQYFNNVCNELLVMILSHCSASDILNVGMTCRRFRTFSFNCESIWKRLCLSDFNVPLPFKEPFLSYHEIYKYLYQSRLLMGSLVYGRYFTKRRLPSIPGWIWCWASLSQNPPVMKFGKERFAHRCSGFYLRKFSNIPIGQMRKVWGLTSPEDLVGLYPSRIQKGTIYYSWHAVRYACIRKRKGFNGFYTFMLKKCSRAKGHVARNYEKIKGTNPIVSL